MRFNPHPYQSRAIEFALEHPKCALWMEMGLGKTVTSLTVIGELLDQCAIRKVLIVAPLRVAQITWPDEIGKWEHTRWLRYSLILGDAKARRRAYRSDAGIHIINFDNLYWLYEELLSTWDYDMIVVDESSKVKNHNALRTRVLKTYQDRTERMLQLTGTPAANSYLDLWSQAYLLDKGERLGKKIGDYRAAFFDKSFNGYVDEYALRPGANKEIQAKLSDICLSMRAKDYLDLPPVINNIIGVRLPARAMKQYTRLEDELIAELDSGAVVEAANAAVATGKCLQAANGALYLDEFGNWEALHDAKLDALESVINEASGSSVLIGTAFRSDAARIQARFPQAVVMGASNTDRVVKNWNTGKIPILVAHPASAGHGLNLQDGGNIVCWYGLNWSLELYEQFNARLARQGQTKPVFVHHIVASGTLDEAVLDRLINRREAQDALKDALSRRVR